MSVEQFVGACGTGDMDTVRQSGAVVGVNCQLGNGASGVMRSISHKQMLVFYYLLSLPDIDVNLSNSAGYTAAHYAIYFTNEEALRALVNRADIDLTIMNKDGQTAKELATKDGKHGSMAIIEEAEKVKDQTGKRKKIKAPTEEETRRELATGVSALVGSEDLADLTIICKEQTFRCHKVVLAARSEVWSIFCIPTSNSIIKLLTINNAHSSRSSKEHSSTR